MGPCGPAAPSHPATEAERPEGLSCDEPRVGTRRRRRDGLRPHPRRRTLRRPVPRGHARGGADLLHRAVRGPRDRGPAAGAAGAVGEADARRGDDDREDGPRPGHRRQRRRRPAVARRPARLARAGDRRPAAGAQGGARQGRGGEQGRQGGHRRRGREARGLPGLAQRRHPDARAARPVEGAPPHRPGDRRRAVEAVLGRADDVHPPPQGALRRAAGEARRRPGREGAAGQAGRGAGRRRPTGGRPRASTAT